GTGPAAEATFAAGLAGLSADHELAPTLRACRSAASGFGHADSPAATLDDAVERAGQGLATPAERLQLGHGALAVAFAGGPLAEVRRLGRAALEGGRLHSGRASEMSAMMLATAAL